MVGTYGNPHIYGKKNLVTIGNYCSFAPGVSVLSQRDHDIHRTSTYPFHEKLGLGNPGCATGKGPIKIGNDVWVGMNATILSGVNIGDGAVIGAGSVISKDVRPYSIVAGNPAKEIGQRFNEETIGLLLRLKWWEWDEKKIKKNAFKLTSEPDLAWIKEMLK